MPETHRVALATLAAIALAGACSDQPGSGENPAETTVGAGGGAATSGDGDGDGDGDGPSGPTGGAGASGGGAATTSGAGTGGGAEVCLGATEACEDGSDCCDGLSCGNTTLGQVCCGEESAPCATPNGEDCCGDLLCVAGSCLAPGAVPNFKAPFPCGQTWTYSHHSQEVRRALDFIDNGGNTSGAPALAAASGVATQHSEPGGAGNYIVVTHGGGWKTYYFHLSSFSVADGTPVAQGQEVGLVGSTGASSGPHLHFEELYNGEGKDIWLDGVLLTPYPGSYGQKSLTSANCP